MDPNLECCVLGCHAKPNQGLHFYRFPCHNPQISSIWEQRICQSANIDIPNDHVCELHFDYRCKTGNECTLEEGSLPTLYLPSFGTVSSMDNAHFQMGFKKIEEPSYTISLDTLSYHCRFCLRRGLLYEVEASTYRSKSFLSLIDLPQNVLPDNTQPNACLSCLKSIVIAHQLSMALEQSNTILKLLLQHPKQSKLVSNTIFFDMKSELAFFNLILANSLSIKLEIEFEDNMVCANEDDGQIWVATGEPASPADLNIQNMVEKSICTAENQDNVFKMNDSVTSDKQCEKELHKSFAIREYATDISPEEIPNASENSESCVLMENTDGNVKVIATNTDYSCVEDRQFDIEQMPDSSKVVNELIYNCDMCKFTTTYKANLAIHKNLHLGGNVTIHFYCQKCEKYFLLRRHFVRHNTIMHADDFTCKICDKPHASAIKLAIHYTEYHRFQCDISWRVLRSGHRAHIVDHKQGQKKSSTPIDKNHHWNENDGVYVCPICDWKNSSFHTFNVHMGKHKVQSDKNSIIGSQELEKLKTKPVRIVDGRYRCTKCPKVFDFKSFLKVHKRLHTNDRPYKCTECSKSFLSMGHLNRHKSIHTNERPYKCAECPKAFKIKNYLSQHRRIHANERPYKCTECPKTFSQKFHLVTHMRLHMNDRPYKCTECSKTFVRKSDLVTHKRSHMNERPYKCNQCPKAFNFKTVLTLHMGIHTNERPYKCTECPKAFRYNSNLIQHKKMHTKDRPFKCTECPKAYSNKSHFNVHKKMHTNERPYKCTECPKAFNRNSHLTQHKRIHTNERPYKCSECPKTFINKSNLIQHKRTHTKEKPYKCTDCPKTFSYKSSCVIHKSRHTNERPYKCTECPKTFSCRDDFNQHKRRHTNERPYKCTECPKTFSCRDDFNRHKRIHTNEKP